MSNHRNLRPFQPLAAILAAGRLWLIEIALWLTYAGVLDRAICADLRRELNRLHYALMLDVFRRTLLTAPAMKYGPLRLRAPPSGFAYGREAPVMRLLWRTARRGVGLIARVRNLRDAMANTDRLVARFARRLAKSFQGVLVLRSAPHDRVRPKAAPGPLPRDSS